MFGHANHFGVDMEIFHLFVRMDRETESSMCMDKETQSRICDWIENRACMVWKHTSKLHLVCMYVCMYISIYGKPKINFREGVFAFKTDSFILFIQIQD